MYTRAGDQGYTGLLGKERVPKYDLRPDAYGQVDEAQAVLGLCRAGPLSQRGRDLLIPIERDLYHMMAELATAPGVELPLPPVTQERVEWLESVTDELGQVTGPFTDTMLIHALVAPDQRHSMDYVAESLLNYSPVKLSDLAALPWPAMRTWKPV